MKLLPDTGKPIASKKSNVSIMTRDYIFSLVPYLAILPYIYKGHPCTRRMPTPFRPRPAVSLTLLFPTQIGQFRPHCSITSQRGHLVSACDLLLAYPCHVTISLRLIFLFVFPANNNSDRWSSLD